MRCPPAATLPTRTPPAGQMGREGVGLSPAAQARDSFAAACRHGSAGTAQGGKRQAKVPLKAAPTPAKRKSRAHAHAPLPSTAAPYLHRQLCLCGQQRERGQDVLAEDLGVAGRHRPHLEHSMARHGTAWLSTATATHVTIKGLPAAITGSPREESGAGPPRRSLPFSKQSGPPRSLASNTGPDRSTGASSRRLRSCRTCASTAASARSAVHLTAASGSEVAAMR